jgi:hypothetical protein
VKKEGPVFKEDRVFRCLRILSLVTISLALAGTTLRLFDFFHGFRWTSLIDDRTATLKEFLNVLLDQQAFLVCYAAMVYALSVIGQSLRTRQAQPGSKVASTTQNDNEPALKRAG